MTTGQVKVKADARVPARTYRGASSCKSCSRKIQSPAVEEEDTVPPPAGGRTTGVRVRPRGWRGTGCMARIQPAVVTDPALRATADDHRRKLRISVGTRRHGFGNDTQTCTAPM